MNLIEIGKKYPSSKNISGFIQLYEKYFSSLKNSKINILEIGVEGGDSLRIWREYFTCLLYTSPSPRDATLSRMPSSA